MRPELEEEPEEEEVATTLSVMDWPNRMRENKRGRPAAAGHKNTC